MKMFNNMKKGQSLPLNTIVIAILVIIVLLVIIVFFTSKVGDSGNKIDALSGCDIGNIAVSSLGYKSVNEKTVDKDSGTCPTGQDRISVVPSVTIKSSDGTATNQIKICCGTKN